jgi:formamidase
MAKSPSAEPSKWRDGSSRYSGEQAYIILGAAPVEGRISGIVDIPNACCSLYLPTAIFDFDVRPTAEGPRKADRGRCAVTS